MADLKSLLGDKYTEGMTIEDLLSLEVEEPKADTAAYNSLKKRFDMFEDLNKDQVDSFKTNIGIIRRFFDKALGYLLFSLYIYYIPIRQLYN